MVTKTCVWIWSVCFSMFWCQNLFEVDRGLWFWKLKWSEYICTCFICIQYSCQLQRTNVFLIPYFVRKYCWRASTKKKKKLAVLNGTRTLYTTTTTNNNNIDLIIFYNNNNNNNNKIAIIKKTNQRQTMNSRIFAIVLKTYVKDWSLYALDE